jgi:beta-lactamase regulating signal transducer with metallopeptidase domain
MEFLLNAKIEIVPALAAALLHSLWQCALLAVAAEAAMRLLNRKSPALRHTVGMVFLSAMAALPILTLLQGLSPQTANTNDWTSIAPAMPSIQVLPTMSAEPPRGLAMVLSGFWMFGFTFMLLRQIGGLWWVDRLARRDFAALPSHWLGRFAALQRTMGVSRAIHVRVADDVLVPFTARLLRPIIWMPLSLLSRLPHDQIEALLAHELAHIHRLDWLWNGLQSLIEALLFFHPGVWWLSRRIRAEREHACDDLAVAACADRVILAEALAALAHAQSSRPRLLLAADGGPLLPRIKHLLLGEPEPARSWAPFALAAIIVAGIVFTAPLGTGHAAPTQRAQGRVMTELGVPQARASEKRNIDDAVQQAVLPARGDEDFELNAQLDAERAFLVAQIDAQLADEEAIREAELEAQLNGEKRLREAKLTAQLDAERAHDAAQRAREQEQRAREAVIAAGDAEQRALEDAQGSGRSIRSVQPVDPVRTVPSGYAAETDDATQAILKLVAADSSVMRKLGTPVAVSSDGFTGRWGSYRNSDRIEDVRISFELTGPKGRAKIFVSAVSLEPDAPWRLTRLDVTDF